MRAARRRRARRGDRARRRQRALRARAHGAASRTWSCCWTSTPSRPGSACGGRETAAGALGRPLARDREAFIALHAAAPRAVRAAGARVPAGACARRRAARARALRALAAAPRGTRLLWAQSASGDYPVLIGRGLLRAAGAGDRRELWPLDRARSRAFCVTDETVARALRASELGEPAGRSRSPPGEQQQDARRRPSACGTRWCGAGMTRADHVVALGGGVVGDLAGFCAATYQRGVPVVQVPTTLVAQVDSAYGGKTGVDLPEAKNYVGAYHQPAGVLVDPRRAATLPAQELAAGWVEVLKTALIAGGELWERVAAGEELDERHDPRLRAHEARGRRRRRARRRPPPGAEPRPHGRPRDRDGHRLRALPPRRGGRPRAARRAAAVRRRTSCASRCASCCARAAAGRARAARTSRQVLAATRARQEAHRRDAAVRARRRARARSRTAARSPPASCARPSRSCARDERARDERHAASHRSCTASTSTSSAAATRRSTGR